MDKRLDSKERTSKNGIYYRTERRWLRPVGEGGDSSAIIWGIEAFPDEERGPWVSMDIRLTDCSEGVTYSFYMSEHKHYVRSMEMLDNMLDQLTIAKIALYEEAKRHGFTKEGDK